jgi:hypothetical protein
MANRSTSTFDAVEYQRRIVWVMVMDATSKRRYCYLSECPASWFWLSSRHEWVFLNWVRTNQGRCDFLMHRWRFGEAPTCDCGADQQTMSHIIKECPRKWFPGGLATLNSADPDAVEYLMNLDLNLWFSLEYYYQWSYKKIIHWIWHQTGIV